MAKFNFTETRIKALRPPAAGEETHSDLPPLTGPLRMLVHWRPRS